jgi:anti-sigma B factor antagonist
MEVSTKTEEGILIASVQDNRIDAAAALAFKEAMRQTADDAGALAILDLGKVDFIDSSGLGAIVAAMKYFAPDRRLILAGLTPAVSKVFTLTRMDRVFDIFLTVDEAVEVQRVGSH